MIATVREENISSWKVVEKAGFALVERKLYQDINDDKEEMYRFYEMKDLTPEKAAVPCEADRDNVADIAQIW